MNCTFLAKGQLGLLSSICSDCDTLGYIGCVLGMDCSTMSCKPHSRTCKHFDLSWYCTKVKSLGRPSATTF